jgi:hypothetical protein
MYPKRPLVSLEKFFAGITEQTFEGRFGIADPPLVDYVATLLTRFVRTDALHSVRGPSGKRLEGVVDMLTEANERVGAAQREVHRHIGDFTLFWSGVYPEALRRLQAADRKDYLVDYAALGKRSYRLASTLCEGDSSEQGTLLERLSREFEVCVRALGEIRREWELRDPSAGDAAGALWIE